MAGCDDKIRFIPQLCHFLAAEISIPLQVFPLKVVYINAPVSASVLFQYEYFAFNGCFLRVELRGILLG
jgi:hypothetical protein